MVRLLAAASNPLTTSVRRRPSRSAAMPLGTSPSRLTTWKMPSASPICHSANPRPASSATHTAPVTVSAEEKE